MQDSEHTVDWRTRWDMHTERQVAASKAGVTAVTVLNTGSWLALLSQASEMSSIYLSFAFLTWALGAFLGTSLWLLIYRGTFLSYEHECDMADQQLRERLNKNIKLGVAIAISSLVTFFIGAILVALAVAQTGLASDT